MTENYYRVVASTQTRDPYPVYKFYNDPEEYEEDWGKDLKDWTEEFESAILESIRRSQLWTKQQQERI